MRNVLATCKSREASNFRTQCTYEIFFSVGTFHWVSLMINSESWCKVLMTDHHLDFTGQRQENVSLFVFTTAWLSLNQALSLLNHIKNQRFKKYVSVWCLCNKVPSCVFLFYNLIWDFKKKQNKAYQHKKCIIINKCVHECVLFVFSLILFTLVQRNPYYFYHICFVWCCFIH